MSTSHECVEIVRVKPKPGAEERLLELRPQIVDGYKAEFGDKVDARLSRCEDGTWVDVWTWETRALADAALADTSGHPAFEEWVTLVEPVGFDWATPIR